MLVWRLECVLLGPRSTTPDKGLKQQQLLENQVSWDAETKRCTECARSTTWPRVVSVVA